MDRLLRFLERPELDGRFGDKLRVMTDFTVGLAGLSTCRRASVGALVATPSLTEVLAIGYNGPPVGQGNDECRDVVGGCGCVHAEANAIVKLSTRERDLLMLTTTSPCEACAGLIANCGRIAVVLWNEPYRDQAGQRVLTRASILARELSDHAETANIILLKGANR